MEDFIPWRLIVAPFEETMNSLLQQVDTSLVWQLGSCRYYAGIPIWCIPVILQQYPDLRGK